MRRENESPQSVYVVVAGDRRIVATGTTTDEAIARAVQTIFEHWQLDKQSIEQVWASMRGKAGYRCHRATVTIGDEEVLSGGIALVRPPGA